MANYSTDPVQLRKNAACFMDDSNSNKNRRAIALFLKLQNLKAIGGTDYTNGQAGLTALRLAAGKWLTFAKNERESIGTWISMENAIFDGAVINTNINQLKTNSRFYLPIPDENLDNLLLFVGALINTAAKPD
jgi:hypothetical protein